MEDFFMTTASSLEGYIIVKQCGIVFGETIFKNSALDSLSAGISNVVDSFRLKSTEMTGQLSLIENARRFAYNKMVSEAKSRGANAIIAIDSDNTIGANSIMYISLFGTAVKVISIEEKERYDQRQKEIKRIEQKEKERQEEENKAYQERMAKLLESDKDAIEKQFLQEIQTEMTMKSISEIWEKTSLSARYPEIDNYIKEQVKIEELYGYNLTQKKRNIIRKMLLEVL